MVLGAVLKAYMSESGVEDKLKEKYFPSKCHIVRVWLNTLM